MIFLGILFSWKPLATGFLRDSHHADLGAIYVNISKTDGPPVPKSEVFRLDWILENTPPHLNRGQFQPTHKSRQDSYQD